ncbi:MAG: hypothetical protein FWH53_07615 [Leptospirales bacterium]|nr:hypothetical protein [Leptospirales bacterium]MCL2155513.1 hypothetical protein [Leptospirales bacterium]
MKILILGGGIAAHRYVESLLWTPHEVFICGFDIKGQSKRLSNDYSLPYTLFFDLSEYDINDFETIIACVALTDKYKIIYRLINDLKYNNCIIIEKPLSIYMNELESYYNLLSPLKSYAVVCQRDFAASNYKILISDMYNITWLSITDDIFSNMINMLPHLLSWLILEIGDDIKLNVVDNELHGTICNKRLYIRFEKSSNNRVIINNTVYETPNYRLINSKVADIVYSFSKNDSIINLNRAIAVSKIVSKLVEESHNV